MAEDEQQSHGRLLNKLLEGSSPRTPTYVLATITCDFTARRGTTELSVRRGDDVYVMFALRGWAFAAHMAPGSHRGYVPLGYCRAVEDFYESTSQMDTQDHCGTQQREQPQAAHSRPQSFGEEALSTGLAAPECEIYPPPKEFQSSSSSSASGDTDSGETARIPSTANFPDSGRQSLFDYASTVVSEAIASHQRCLKAASASATSNSRTPVADVTLACSTRHDEPTDYSGGCTHRADASQRRDLRALSQQRSSLLPLPLPTCCASQDESGIGDSNGSSTSSSLDWCWEARLSPEASTAASDDRCTDVSTGYAADSSHHSSSISSSCSVSTHEGVEICPCCLCPWPCTNTRLPTCDCLCQGLAYYKQYEQATAWQPALTSLRPTTGQVAAKAQMQSTREYHHYDKQCGDGAGGRLRLADGNPSGYRSPATTALVWGEAQQQQQQLLLLLKGAARNRQACDEGYEEDEDDVFASSGVQQQQHRRPPHSRSDGPSPRVTFNLLPRCFDHHRWPQASGSPTPLEGRQQKDPLR